LLFKKKKKKKKKINPFLLPAGKARPLAPRRRRTYSLSDIESVFNLKYATIATGICIGTFAAKSTFSNPSPRGKFSGGNTGFPGAALLPED